MAEPNRFTLWGSLNFMWSVASDGDGGRDRDRDRGSAHGHESARERCQ